MTLKARITAIDRFIKGLKEDNIYADLQAACVMAGWSNLAGALTPLKGAAPTTSSITEYDRGMGIYFDGASSTLNLNRAVSSDDKDDCHAAAFHSSLGTNGVSVIFSHVNNTTTGAIALNTSPSASPPTFGGRFRHNNNTGSVQWTSVAGFGGASRNSAAGVTYRWNDDSAFSAIPSVSGSLGNYRLGQYYSTYSDGDVGFYSVGSGLDLGLLYARVSTLMADLRAIEEVGFDRDAIAYIRAVEEADGAYLETSVKVAVNNLVSGLKADGLWESIGSSCLLCGPRTLAGALMPLKGDAPTAYSFSSGDYLRSAGLKGDGATTSLDTNYGPENLNDADVHLSVYMTQKYDSGTANRFISQDNNNLTILDSSGATGFRTRVVSSTIYTLGTSSAVPSLVAVSRSSAESFAWFAYGENGTQSDSGGAVNEAAGNPFVFKGSVGSTNFSANRFAFYSIGSSIDLAALDSHISSYVTAIGAAI